MKMTPVSGVNNIEKASAANGYVPATRRFNQLSDMDFNIIADTIRCQNLKNKMNIRLINLKRNIGSSAAKNLYQSS